MEWEPLGSLASNRKLQTEDQWRVSDSKGELDIDLSMDREARRRRRQEAGRSGGIFQASPFATDLWDIQYEKVLPTDWSSNLDSGRNSSDEEITQCTNNGAIEQVTNIADLQRNSDNEEEKEIKGSSPDDNDVFIDLMADESPEIMTATKHTLLSALPIRLNVRKSKGLNMGGPHLSQNQHPHPVATQAHERWSAKQKINSSKLKRLQDLTFRLQDVIDGDTSSVAGYTH